MVPTMKAVMVQALTRTVNPILNQAPALPLALALALALPLALPLAQAQARAQARALGRTR